MPASLEDITPAYLTGLIATRHPGVTVTGLQVREKIQGTGTKVFLELDYAAPTDVPRLMWLKTGFDTAHVHKALALGLYAREAQCYAEILPTTTMRVPDCYGYAYDLATGEGTVLLENLTRPDIRFPRYTETFSVDMVADGLESLAALHGSTWESPKLGQWKLPPMMAPGSAHERHFQTYDVSSIAEFMDGEVGEAMPPEVRDSQRTHDALWALQPHYLKGPHCLQHTDTHPGNIYLDGEGRVGFLDWQLPSVGPWMHDVSYWIAGCLSVEDRRAEERRLLDDYLARMASHGGPVLDREEAWLDYRRFLAYGYWVWLRNPSSMQPIANNLALSKRYGPAMADHDVFGLLGV